MKKTFSIITFGCQMNKADSEIIAGLYTSRGYKGTAKPEEADEIIINTCSVRQSAEDRVAGKVLNLAHGKHGHIIVTGCILRYGEDKLRKLFPSVDKFIKISELIKTGVKPVRKEKKHAWVKIMEGCDNYCTYCVVPYSRGREVSREPEEIICEVKELAARGYTHITLLGQNVNSYGKKFAKTSFANLLTMLNDIENLEKISFITSNPQDLTDDIIEAMSLPKIDRYLHLPVQSGDDLILQRMNRKYTADQYLRLLKKIRTKIPDIEIGTDIIVGFPGETAGQFQNTVLLCKSAQFSVAYIAKYSPRPGTGAYKFSDDVTPAEKKKRWEILDNFINKNSRNSI